MRVGPPWAVLPFCLCDSTATEPMDVPPLEARERAGDTVGPGGVARNARRGKLCLVRPLDIVRKVVEAGAALRKRRAEGEGLVSLDAGLRVVEATTEVARRARAGPLPPARGLERVALTAAEAQLRMMAGMLGIAVSAPADRALVREEKEAQVRAALGALVSEALALVEAVLATPPEMGAARERALG